MDFILVKDFSLEFTIESGQFFYFEKINDYYYIIEENRIFKLKQIEDKLFYEGINENYLINFLGLKDDLIELTKDFKNDKYLKIALKKYWGLRSQNTSPWQTIISFICSSASSIEKIKLNLKLLSKEFGEKIIFDDREFFLFPKIGSLNNLEKIKKSKVGFRSKYIFDFNSFIKENPNYLNDLSNLNYEELKLSLIKFNGIGFKIADCISLFAFNKKEVFPIDTWIKQVIERLYLKKKVKNLKEINSFIEFYFKNNKGIKQQYLFHWSRYNLK